MMECMLQSCLIQTRFWSSCLSTDLFCFCSEPKNSYVSVMTRHAMISSLRKTCPLWITLFSEISNPKRCGATKINLQILRWFMLFRVTFLRRKKELFVAMVLHTFPQTPPYNNFWTTWICQTLPLSNQQFPPSPGRKLWHYSASGPHCPTYSDQETSTAIAAQQRGHTFPLHPEKRRPHCPLVTIMSVFLNVWSKALRLNR